MEYTIVFITYKTYSCFYECNNRNITPDVFKKYARIKEEMVESENRLYTRIQSLPSEFPDMFNRTYYHPSVIRNVLLLLNARTEKQYTPYYISLTYKNELWCFEKDGYCKPLFFNKIEDKNIYNDTIKSFLQDQFPITNADIYKHPYKELKYLKLPNAFYFTKGIYIKNRFFDYIIDLIKTPSIIFKDHNDYYLDDKDAFINQEYVPYEFTDVEEEQEPTEYNENTIEEAQKNYIDDKINRSIETAKDEQSNAIAVL